jgi:hypothetical protein
MEKLKFYQFGPKLYNKLIITYPQLPALMFSLNKVHMNNIKTINKINQQNTPGAMPNMNSLIMNNMNMHSNSMNMNMNMNINNNQMNKQMGLKPMNSPSINHYNNNMNNPGNLNLIAMNPMNIGQINNNLNNLNNIPINMQQKMPNYS